MSQRKDNSDSRGCLGGLISLFGVSKIYSWCQEHFGTGRGGCIGTGCGCLLTIILIMVVFSILFGTDWTQLSF